MRYCKGEVTDFQDNQFDSEAGPYLPLCLPTAALVTHIFPLMSYIRKAHGLVSAGQFHAGASKYVLKSINIFHESAMVPGILASMDVSKVRG